MICYEDRIGIEADVVAASSYPIGTLVCSPCSSNWRDVNLFENPFRWLMNGY